VMLSSFAIRFQRTLPPVWRGPDFLLNIHYGKICLNFLNIKREQILRSTTLDETNDLDNIVIRAKMTKTLSANYRTLIGLPNRRGVTFAQLLF
jgi:hypothetical protein